MAIFKFQTQTLLATYKEEFFMALYLFKNGLCIVFQFQLGISKSFGPSQLLPSISISFRCGSGNATQLRSQTYWESN